MTGGGRVDLDAVETGVRAVRLRVADLERRLIHQWARDLLTDMAADIDTLVAELRVARDKLDAIQRLLAASPIGPTRAQAVSTLFEIRLVATDEFDQHDPPATHDQAGGG